MTPINQKNNEILSKIFKGNQGKESQIQNDSILSLLIRQDAIIESMSSTQRAKYDKNIKPYLEFTNKTKETALSSYENKMKILGRKSIFSNVLAKENKQQQQQQQED